MSDTPQELNVPLAVRQALESLHRAGVQQWPRVAPRAVAAACNEARDDVRNVAQSPPRVSAPVEPAPPAIGAAPLAAQPERAPAGGASPISPSVSLFVENDMPRLSRDQRVAALQVLREEVAACRACPELVAHRTQTVFGVGPPQPRLVFFGEAPGADEDRQGEPFVGRAGQLLNDIIEKGMQLRRDDVYIMNVLKCRPPGNRNPEPDEVARCRPFFERQLAVLRPEFICCLGLHAAQALLQTKASVGKLRGQLHEAAGARVLVTYHPAYLLRNPAAKKDTWQDIQLLMQAMGLPVP